MKDSSVEKKGKYCQNCGNLISVKAVMCPKCGFMVNNVTQTINKKDRVNPMAITSLVTGIVSLPCGWAWGAGIVLAIAAVVLGILDLRNINEGKSSSKSKGFDIAGIACGGVGIFIFIIFIVFVIIGINYGY